MILVDALGIGGSGNVTDKLIEYLPNALLLIFVVNAGSASGMQKKYGIYSAIKFYIYNILPNQTKIKEKHSPVFYVHALVTPFLETFPFINFPYDILKIDS